ncbi:MAG TPA: type III pantothenate kinase [Gemmataceae bacterium]|nr:type III pantothenate kinase [Gemmataceae bacterium]
MKPDIVVDVGNSRIKWGFCNRGRIADVASLPPDNEAAWRNEAIRWQLFGSQTWAVSGVHPTQQHRLIQWLTQDWFSHHRGQILLVNRAEQLPLHVSLEQPNKVGIDRLLNAVAAAKHPSRGRLPAIIVDAGSAVTVDWLDDAGSFCGGAIIPGLRLMAQALHEHTALLPLVQVNQPLPSVPGRSTDEAIHAGVYYAVAGAINELTARFTEQSGSWPHVFLTGGDADSLRPAVNDRAELWPEMTLEGIRLTAEAQP